MSFNRLCPACHQQKLYYRNGLPISKYCDFCKKQKAFEKKEKKKHSISKLREELEGLAKDAAKRRDNYICQKCGKKAVGSDAHGSHVVPVSHGNQFRFDVENIKTLCMYCHIHWWHKNPIEAAEWFKKKFPERYEYLYGKPHQSVKFTRSDYEKMIANYKDVLYTFTDGKMENN